MDTKNETKASKSLGRKLALEAESKTTTAAKPKSKTDIVISRLQQLGGATLDDLVKATGWQSHTTRAALTGLRKKGHSIIREKTDGTSRYRIDGAAQ